MEAIHQIKTGDLISLSKQQLVDCHKKSCGRHYLDQPYEYIIKNGGIDTEKDYPYEAKIKKCNTTKAYICIYLHFISRFLEEIFLIYLFYL